MKILITGSKGQLGSSLRKIAGKYSHAFLYTDIEELDISNESEVADFFEKERPDCVINCAGYTAVDKAETEIDKALILNATAPRILAETCHIHHAVLIHISTDFVFDGSSSKPYVETDAESPVNVYGQTKLEGEIQVIRENPDSIIIRTSWLYSTFGNNFVKTMIRLGRENDRINVIFDQIGSPTYAGDLAQAILDIINKLQNRKYSDNNIFGIYHYSNEGIASWYDFAYEIFALSNIKVSLNPVHSTEFSTPARRPHYSVLDKTKIKSVFNINIPHWKQSLMRCLAEMQ